MESLLNTGIMGLKALTMDAFELAIEEIIKKSGFENCNRIKLMEDASTRTYERLVLGDKTAILMKAPLGNENPPCPKDADIETRLELGWNASSRLAASRVEAFVAIGEFLSENGFSTPVIYASDCEQGLAIIEDLGNDLFAEVLKENPEQESDLYHLAGALLANLHALEIPDLLKTPNGEWPILGFDTLALTVNADLFVDWVPKYLGLSEYSQEVLASWAQIRTSLIAKIIKHPRAFTLRDYHAENMLWLNDRDGKARIGLLDFQDAVLGYRAWDFSMLLHDARRDVTPQAQQDAIAAYVLATNCDEAQLRNEIDIEGAINILRIIGIFSRLVKRDGKEKYRQFMPRMIGHLNNVLQNPQLSELKQWIEKNAPLHELMNV
jgi:N-acetylmuramate 1-kinase